MHVLTLFSRTTSGSSHWIASHTAPDQQMDWAMVLYPVDREESHDHMEGMYNTLTEIHVHVLYVYQVITYLETASLYYGHITASC